MKVCEHTLILISICALTAFAVVTTIGDYFQNRRLDALEHATVTIHNVEVSYTNAIDAITEFHGITTTNITAPLNLK